ncbi:MAG: hypothetical protein U0325_23725 [Polyangiales bacterium]
MSAWGLLGFALDAFGCAPAPAPPTPTARVDASVTVPRWSLQASSGASFAAGPGRVWGALRAMGGRVGEGPLPASPLVLAAQLDETRWRFASADGTLYAAEGFLGPLRRVGALRHRPRALDPSTPRFGRGALVVVDARDAVWIDDGDGPPRRVPAPPAAHALALRRGAVLITLLGGRVARSDDGGRTVRELPPPEGAAWDVGLDAQGAFVRGPLGAFRLDGERWSRVALPAEIPAPEPPAPRDPALPARAASVTWARGQYFVADGDTVRRCASLDACARDPAPLRAPGVDCALHALRGSLVAVCLREGWARVASVYDATAGAWRTLRDEARGAPMGDARFDPLEDLWAVAAACTQRPEADRRRLCVVRGGAPVEHALPFPVRLQGVHGGAVLALDADAPPQGPVRAALLRADGVTPFAIPYPRESVWRATLRGDLIIPHRDDASGPLRALVRGDLRASPPRWRAQPAPPGSTDLVVTPEGDVLTFGADAQSLAWLDGAGARRPLPSPVDGDPRTLRLEAAGDAYCVGDVCRLGANLALHRGDARPSMRALARTDLPDDAPAVTPTRPLRVRCVDDGPAGPGVEMDHGAAMAGYAILARRTEGGVSAAWFGPRVNGRASAPWPGAPGEVFFAVGAVGATRPNALLGRCESGRCEHALLLADGLRALELPRAAPGEAGVFTEGSRWIVRVDPGHPSMRATQLAVVRDGAPTVARGALAFTDRARGVDAGSLDGDDGLWVQVAPSRLRFFNLRGEARGEGHRGARGLRARRRPAGRDPSRRGRGRRAGRRVAGGGRQWVLEETLRLRRRGLHRGGGWGRAPRGAAALGARREERREVRTFALRAEGRDVLRGAAWGGRRAYPQRCALNP